MYRKHWNFMLSWTATTELQRSFDSARATATGWSTTRHYEGARISCVNLQDSLNRKASVTRSTSACVLRTAGLWRDSEKFVEHFPRVVLGFQLLQALVLLTKHILRLFLVFFVKSVSSHTHLDINIISTALTVVIAVHHRGSMLTPLPNPPVFAVYRFRAATLQLCLQHLCHFTRSLATYGVVRLIMPDRADCNVAMSPAVRKSHRRIRHFDDLAWIQQSEHKV
jgi:hypothetical protein